MRFDSVSDGKGLRDHIRVLAHRKWLLLVCVVLVPAAAVGFSLRQTPLYEASADVLLSNQNLGAALIGIQNPTPDYQPERTAQTQVDLARTPAVAALALEAAGQLGNSSETFLDMSSVVASGNSDILEFSVTDESPERAQELATAYATAYTRYRQDLDTAALVQAREEAEAQIAQLERQGDTGSALYAALVEKDQQLRTLEALQTSNASVVRTPTGTATVQPKTVRNGLLGLALGMVLGLTLVFLREALDTRIRSADDIAEPLGLPLLARLPRPPRKLRRSGQLVMVSDPAGTQAEAFRMLRQNLEFASLEHDVRTVMVTSALPEEGKSTTAANLAVALARAGEKVVLVDLDLRDRSIDLFFGLQARAGLTDVALGRIELDAAIASIGLTAAPGTSSRLTRNGRPPEEGERRLQGVLDVLTSGPLPPDAGEFVASAAVKQILDALRARADHVIVDAPPLLGLGDALTLSSRVDGLIVVARLKALRRGTLRELARVLAQVPTRSLGFVVTDSGTEAPYDGYGYARAYPTAPKEREVVR